MPMEVFGVSLLPLIQSAKQSCSWPEIRAGLHNSASIVILYGWDERFEQHLKAIRAKKRKTDASHTGRDHQ
jgi:hypothetical protein